MVGDEQGCEGANPGVLFAKVPYELIDDPRVDALAVATYVALRRFAGFTRGEGGFPSDATASAVAGCSVRTFSARRELLRRLGWVDWRPRPGRTNLYIVRDRPTPAADADPTSAGDAEGDEPPQLLQTPSVAGAAPSASLADPPLHRVPTTEIQHRDPDNQNQDGDASPAAPGSLLAEVLKHPDLSSPARRLILADANTARERGDRLVEELAGANPDRNALWVETMAAAELRLWAESRALGDKVGLDHLEVLRFERRGPTAAPGRRRPRELMAG